MRRACALSRRRQLGAWLPSGPAWLLLVAALFAGLFFQLRPPQPRYLASPGSENLPVSVCGCFMMSAARPSS